VELGPDVNLWFGAVVRGDDERIEIGARTNLQDNAVVHADPGVVNRIGEDCVIGHQALLHGARVGDRCLIGMGSILLSRSEVGDECIVGAGAIVTEGKRIPPRSLVLGAPARVVREVTDEEIAFILEAAAGYVEKARGHCEGRFG
jgi:carbonic anhydrase/acetyltransferase-like protein (isoleucine patch superfamily)